jgi:transposase-like protein
MHRRYPPEIRRQVVELARAGTRVQQLVTTFGMSEATIYNWLKQEQIDRGEIEGLSTDQALELAAAKRRIKQLETELAVSRKVNEIIQRSPDCGRGRRGRPDEGGALIRWSSVRGCRQGQQRSGDRARDLSDEQLP